MPQIVRVVLALLALTAVGTMGFAWIEGWNLADSMYMAVITMTTVGFNEVHPLSSGGRTFAMVFLVVGLGVFMFGAVTLGELIVRAQLGEWLGRNKMSSTLGSIHGHFVVCGLGRFGRTLCEQLESLRLPFVVIEADPEVADVCKERNWLFVIGDATEDPVLVSAGIHRARGIACTLPSDAENLYVVMSARLLCKDIQILSRATTEKAGEKLHRAGANRVISLYATSAIKMAQLMANPHVQDFFEVVTAKGKSFDLVQIRVEEGASYAGVPLSRSGLREKGVMVVCIRRADGEVMLPPAPTDQISVGDSLTVLGKIESLQELMRGAGD